MLSSDFSQQVLKLNNIIIKNIINEPSYTLFNIKLPRKVHCCPACSSLTDKVHDYRLQKIKDIPSFGSFVLLILRKRRYVCTACNKKFYESIDFLPKYHRRTSRLAFYILNTLASVISYKSVAQSVNLSCSTVIRIFDHLSYTPSSLPKVLSIGEFKGNTGHEKYQCIIADPLSKKVIDILPNRFKSDLTSYFLKFNTLDDDYIEGINNKIKVLKRNAFGYKNFSRFRNRILHMTNQK